MAGLNHPQPKFISPTNDFNRSGGEGTINVNVQPNMNELANRTSQRIFQVASESPESSELLVGAWFRRSGTPFNFISNIGGPLFRPRLIQLRNVIMPHILNMNRNNNRFCFQFVARASVTAVNSEQRIVNPTNVEFTFEPKFYTPDTFGSELNLLVFNAINAQMPGNFYETNQRIVSVDSVTVSSGYDEETMRFILDINIDQITVEDVNPPGPPTAINGAYLFKYWMTDDCSFIRFGKNFVNFPDAPRQILLTAAPDTALIPGLTDPWTPPSGPAVGRGGISFGATAATVTPPLTSLYGPQFIYSRYVTIRSEALSLYAFGESRVDLSGVQTGQSVNNINTVGAGGGGGRIIGVISTAQYFIPTKEFGGSSIITAVNAPSLGIKNAQLKLNEFIDFEIVDEFGFTLDASFPIDNDIGPTLAFIVSY